MPHLLETERLAVQARRGVYYDSGGNLVKKILNFLYSQMILYSQSIINHLPKGGDSYGKFRKS